MLSLDSTLALVLSDVSTCVANKASTENTRQTTNSESPQASSYCTYTMAVYFIHRELLALFPLLYTFLREARSCKCWIAIEHVLLQKIVEQSVVGVTMEPIIHSGPLCCAGMTVLRVTELKTCLYKFPLIITGLLWSSDRSSAWKLPFWPTLLLMIMEAPCLLKI